MKVFGKEVSIQVPSFLRPSQGLRLASSFQVPANAPRGSVLNQILRRQTYRVQQRMDAFEAAIEAAKSVHRPDRQLLYAFYTWFERVDAQYRAVKQTRMEKVLAEKFVLTNDQGVVNEEATLMLRKEWVYDFLRYCLESIFDGHSLIEVDAPRDGEVPACRRIYREQVRPEYGDVVLRPGDQKGLPYRSGPLSRSLIEIGDPNDLGLMELVGRFILWKYFSLTDWSRRSEKYGMPFLVVKTNTQDAKELDKMQQMAENFGANGWMIIDDTDSFELKESNNQSPHVIYQQMSKAMDEYIAKAVLGQTMTTDDGASLSQAQVHERVMNAYVASDMRWLEFVMNAKLLPWLADRGYPVAGHRFQFYMHTDAYAEEQSAATQAAATAAAEQGQLSRAAFLEKKNPGMIRRRPIL